MPTTPLTPTFLVTDIPSDSKCLAITSDVLNSLLDNSGCLWKSCLHEITFCSIFLIWSSIDWEKPNWKMKKNIIVITGGAGFVGTNLIVLLLKKTIINYLQVNILKPYL